MFDDPKKELKELEEQLLSGEEAPEEAMLDEAEFEKLYHEILEEFGPREPETPHEPPIRNYANGYGFYVPPRHEITLAVPEDAQPAEPEPEAPKVRGNGALVLTILLEILAIGAVLALWVLSLMG